MCIYTYTQHKYAMMFPLNQLGDEPPLKPRRQRRFAQLLGTEFGSGGPVPLAAWQNDAMIDVTGEEITRSIRNFGPTTGHS